MPRALCLNSLLPRSTSTTLLRSRSANDDMVPPGETCAALWSIQRRLERELDRCNSLVLPSLYLPTSLLKHPFAECDNISRFSVTGMNSDRATRPRVGL